MKSDEIVFGGIILVVIAKAFYDKIYPDAEQLKQSIISLIYSLNNWKTHLILIILATPFLLYLNYRICLKISERMQERKKEQEEKEAHEKQIEKAINRDIIYLDYEEITEFISSLKETLEIVEDYKEFSVFEKPLKDKLAEANKIKVEKRHEIKLSEQREEKYQLEKDIKELERQKQERAREEEQEQKNILEKLNTDENHVFKKDNLKNTEFKILLGNGYTQTNQYCAYEKKLITVLVKQILNHSLTHIFLVWSVIQLLKNFKGITEIQIHETKDADITFRFNGFIYAVEIETGTLLEKKDQMANKKAYLDRKYPNRYMIIVSNKDLIWQYRKLGFFSTQRNEVEENLEKMLNYSTKP